MVGPLLGFGHFLSAVFIIEHATTTVSLAVVSETVYIMLRVSDPRTVCAITNILDSFRMWILFHVLPLKQPACRYLLTGHIFGLLASDATQDGANTLLTVKEELLSPPRLRHEEYAEALHAAQEETQVCRVWLYYLWQL